MDNLCIAYPNKFTVSETFIANQVKELKPKITLCEGWHPSITSNGKSFFSFPFNTIFLRGLFRNLFPKIYHGIYSKALSRYLVKKRIQVVLANYGPMGVELSDACQFAKVKLVIHFHGFDISDFATLEQYSDSYKKLFNHCKAIVSVSNDMTDRLLNLGADADKIFLNPYGIEVEKFNGAQPENVDPIFIAVGRFTPKKAPQLTIKAFSKVLIKHPNAQLKLIGEGELLEECRLLTIQLGISGNVDFLGRRSADEVCLQLRAARVFVQHSIIAPNGDSEGTPNTILEASATGLPIVSTFHAGIKEAVIHEKTGFLVAEGDWEAMAEYMIRLAANPKLCSEMGKEGRNHILQNYKLKNRIESLKSVLQQ